MSTIAELMKGKKPGEVRVAHPDWEYYYTPFYTDNKGRWYGLDAVGRHSCISESDRWYLYQEPKPKKLVYEWLVESGDMWMLSSLLYDEETARKVFRDRNIKKTGRQFEVEVDSAD